MSEPSMSACERCLFLLSGVVGVAAVRRDDVRRVTADKECAEEGGEVSMRNLRLTL
jgi:hypothetical protein